MGKRELLLVIVFAVAGVLVYQVTAPPAPSGSTTLGGLIERARRAVRGNTARLEVQSTHTEPVDAAIDELHLTLRSAQLTVIGERRDDVTFDLRVNSTGYDEAEAKQHAEATKLKIDRAGPALVVGLQYPREAIQRAFLTIKVPARMRVRIEPSGGRLEVSHVASVEASGMGPGATMTDIAGAVTINQRGGPLTIDRVGSLRLTGRSSDTKIQQVNGTVIVQTSGGEIAISDVAGPLEVEARNTDVRMEQLEKLKPPLRVNATNGSVHIAGLRTDARIDGNDTELDIALDAPAPVTIYNTSQDIVVTPPPAGYVLDAVAADGRITIEDAAIKPSGDETEQRASGSVRGGGAMLTLRTTRGDIVVRSHTGK